MKHKKSRGRPRTKRPTYPLQAAKMEQLLTFLKATGQVKNQEDLTPLFGLHSRTAFNKLFLGKNVLNDRHKQFCFLKTGIPAVWWEHENTTIENAVERGKQPHALMPAPETDDLSSEEAINFVVDFLSHHLQKRKTQGDQVVEMKQEYAQITTPGERKAPHDKRALRRN